MVLNVACMRKGCSPTGSLPGRQAKAAGGTPKGSERMRAFRVSTVTAGGAGALVTVAPASPGHCSSSGTMHGNVLHVRVVVNMQVSFIWQTLIGRSAQRYYRVHSGAACRFQPSSAEQCETATWWHIWLLETDLQPSPLVIVLPAEGGWRVRHCEGLHPLAKAGSCCRQCCLGRQ